MTVKLCDLMFSVCSYLGLPYQVFSTDHSYHKRSLFQDTLYLFRMVKQLLEAFDTPPLSLRSNRYAVSFLHVLAFLAPSQV
jgi:hypothetical protein